MKLFSLVTHNGRLFFLCFQLLLTYDPAKRATAKELLKHSYYSDVDRSKLPDPDYDGSIRLPPRSWIANLITEDYPSTSDM